MTATNVTRLLNPKMQIPEKLTWAEMSNGRRLEVWDCPEVNPRYRVSVFSGKVQIGMHVFSTEISARKWFERRVEEWS